MPGGFERNLAGRVRGRKDDAVRADRGSVRRLWSQVVQAFFEQPLNVVSIMFSLMVGRMAAYVGDQIMVQRLQTTRSLRDARRAFVVNAAGDIIWMFALSFVGLALFAYFQRHHAAA